MITLTMPEWLVWVFIVLALLASVLAALGAFLEWRLCRLKNENAKLLDSLGKQSRKVIAALDTHKQAHGREDNELQ